MSTLVRASGYTSQFNLYGTRAAFTLSDGTAVVVVYDPNLAAAPVNQGDRTGTAKVLVYSSTDRAVWSLRASINAPTSLGKLTANVSENNTVGIVFVGADRSIRYASVSAAWSATGWAVVQSATSGEMNDVDLAFSFGNVPWVTVMHTQASNPRLRVLIYGRRTSDNTWISTTVTTLSGTPATKYAGQSLSTLFPGLNATEAATARRMVIAAAFQTNPADQGVNLYTLLANDTAGTITSLTLRDNYARGEVPKNSNSKFSRNVMLFSSADNEYTLGMQHSEGARRIAMTRGTWDGTNWNVVIPYKALRLGEAIAPFAMTMTYGPGSIVYHYANTKNQLMRANFMIDSESGNVTFGSKKFWDNLQRSVNIGLLGGSGPHVEYSTHDLLFVSRESNNRQQFCHQYAVATPAPRDVLPGAGTVVNTSSPTLRAKGDIDKKYGQSRYKMRWEIASDSAFATNYVEYVQDDSKLKDIDNTDVANAFVPFDDVLGDDFKLKQGNWFIRASHVDELGSVGLTSPVQQFSVAHPPAAVNITPSGGRALVYSGTNRVSWGFTDPYPNDGQTAYRIVIDREEDGAVVFDSGKISSKLSYRDVSISSVHKNYVLRISIILWDSDDVEGAPSPYAYFYVVDAPVGVITSPTTGPINTAIPTITTQVSFSGERKAVAGQVIIKKAGVKVHDSGMVAIDLFTGDAWSYVPPVDVLDNLMTYVIESYVTDSLGITSAAATVAVATSWTPPLPASSIVADDTPYNKEGDGYVRLTWSDVNRDPDFVSWDIYRKVDHVHPYTDELLEPGEWELVPGEEVFRPGVVESQNLVIYPAAEGAVLGWFNSNGWTVTQDSTRAKSGTKSYKLQNTSGAPNGTGLVSTYVTLTGLKPDTDYVVSGYVYIPSGITESARVGQLRAGASTVQVPVVVFSSVPTVRDDWTRNTVAFRTAPGSTSVAIYFYGATGVNDSIWFDNVMVNEGTVAPEYFDGDTPPDGYFVYTWTGTPHQSESVKSRVPSNDFRDYFAPSGYRTYYRVEQTVSRFGDVLSSRNASAMVVVKPISESYWLIDPQDGEAFKLGSVNADSYTDEYEEEVFNVVGRGRHQETGDRLGYSGTLEAKVRDNTFMSARQRRLRIDAIKKSNRKLYLRNPYGDTFRVAISNMTYSRIAGVGLSEFFDLTVPYLEIGDK